MTAPRFVEVALPLPLFQTFTYSVGDGPLPRGGLARARARAQQARDRHLARASRRGEGVARPRAIIDAPDAEPVLSEAMLALCRWIAEYYVVPLGVVMRSVLPVLLTARARADAVREDAARRDDRARAPVAAGARRAVRARRSSARCTRCSSRSAGAARWRISLTQLGFSPSLVRALEARGLDRASRRAVVARDPFAARSHAATPHAPSAAQRDGDRPLLRGEGRRGVPAARRHRQRQDARLHRAAARVVMRARARAAIVLVPEIALTPQTVDRFRAVFGDEIAVLHSALSDGERYDAWLALRARREAHRRRRALGDLRAAREPRRDHRRRGARGELQAGRDAALSRARGRDRARARRGRGRRARQRDAESRELGECGAAGSTRCSRCRSAWARRSCRRVEVVDLRRSAARRWEAQPVDPSRVPFSYVFSEQLEAALGERLQKGEQSILLLNRRGYASFVQCDACGDGATLPELQHQRSRIIARPSGWSATTASTRSCREATCRKCGGTTVRQRGLGTQQVERLLAERFPYGAHRAHGRRHDEREVGARRDPRSRGARRGRHPARHADDREGARLSERHARRRDRRGRRDQPAGLSRVGAVLPAPEPGRGPRGARTEGRARCSSRRACRRITRCSAR